MAARLVAARVISEQAAVDARLREFGLTREVILRAVATGDAADATCTENDPPTIPGSLRWGRSIRSLREDLRPGGWTNSNVDNLPTIVHPERKLAITVARGNEATGDIDADPKTKYARGPACRKRADNNGQLALFTLPPAVVRAPEGMPTYFLMVNPTSTGVEFELSLPSDCDDDGRFSAYVERIVFPPYVRNGSDPRKELEEPLRVDVPVDRR